MTKRKISMKERVEIYENLFRRLNFHRYISGDRQKEADIIKLIDDFVHAGASHDGVRRRTDEEIAETEAAAIEKMRQLP